MSGGLGFIDIILFAMLAAFLIYRLGSVLGKRTGHEQERPDLFGAGMSRDANQEDNVISLPDRGVEPDVEPTQPMTPLDEGVSAICSADQNFDPGEFAQGANSAFEMIVEGFARGDTETLRNLLSDDVYANFATAIQEREAANQTHETTIVGVDVAEIIEAELDGQTALVTMKYVSDQVNVTRGEDGSVVEGDPSAILRITDIWTFARDVSSSDPNWTLVATRSPN
ncbi:MAG: Tim44/TimA family putative adaptor protein [Pseudomonadota bacterium]|nr:Tim44/TimA family putative adaptor protein [Pseudomonadota bacterium]